MPAKVMLHCGSTLALSSKMPSLNVKELSACTPAVWTKCRKQLKAKLEEKLGCNLKPLVTLKCEVLWCTYECKMHQNATFAIFPFFFIVKNYCALAWNCQEKIECNTVLATKRGAARFQGSKVWALNAQPKNLMLGGKDEKRLQPHGVGGEDTHEKAFEKHQVTEEVTYHAPLEQLFFPHCSCSILYILVWYHMNILD